MGSDLTNRVVSRAAEMRRAHPELRNGQAHMNALAELDQALYLEVSITDADCFYDDSKLPALLEEIERMKDRMPRIW